MAKNYYAVKAGHKPGIYKTWAECKKQVDGFSGASYKGFPTLAEAEAFLGTPTALKAETEKIITEASEAVAYVDGSYEDSVKEFSYGLVMFAYGIEEHFAEKFNTPNLVSMRNVAGEIIGAQKAMQYCIDNDIKSLDLYYDYEGIEKWCTGEWKTNKDGTKAYKQFFDSIKSDLKVTFYKVAAHTGDTYNELADQLAKSAIRGDKAPEISYGANSMTANKISYNDLKAVLDLIQEDFSDLILSKDQKPYGKGFTLSINNPSKQKLKIVHYDDKNKLLLQGKQQELFNAIALYIVELLETDEVPRFLNTVYNLEVDKDVIKTEFVDYLPNVNNQLNDKIKNSLHQAIYNLKIQGDMFEYSHLVHPALRPLEAVLKIALQENGIPIRESGKNNDSFFVFTKFGDKFVLKTEYKASTHSDDFLDYISKAYTHYHKHRHTLYHWDNPLAPLDTTRIISNMGEAHSLIKDTLKIINDYYKL